MDEHPSVRPALFLALARTDTCTTITRSTGRRQQLPVTGQRDVGWNYRACIARDPADAHRWRPGAQLRNLRPGADHVEVYVSWVKVPSQGGGNTGLGHKSIESGPAEAGGLAQVVGPAVEHPGDGFCLWAEIAPLMQPSQLWSDSPLVDPHANRCQLD